MAINPVTNNLIESVTQKPFTPGTTKVGEPVIPFQDIFEEAINNVHQTESQVQIDAARAAAGDMDDLHTLTIDIAKADLALSMLVALRNKALEAYNEIMRISM